MKCSGWNKDYVFGGHVSCDIFRFWLVIYEVCLVMSLTKEIEKKNTKTILQAGL